MTLTAIPATVDLHGIRFLGCMGVLLALTNRMVAGRHLRLNITRAPKGGVTLIYVNGHRARLSPKAVWRDMLPTSATARRQREWGRRPDLVISFDPAGRDRGGPGGHTPAAGQRRHGSGVIRHVSDRRAPALSGVLQDRVARMRGADLDDIGNVRLPVIARQPDAAGVDDHPPVSQMDHARNMGVRAENEPRVDGISAGFDEIDRAGTDAAVIGDVFEPEGGVVRGDPWHRSTSSR